MLRMMPKILSVTLRVLRIVTHLLGKWYRVPCSWDLLGLRRVAV
jgi:hypothetical protein